MRFDDLFNDIGQNTAQWLSEDYPVLKGEQKERLYAMSKRKCDIKDVQEDNALEVSGVEKYRRPKWYKGASIAAAVLLVAGIGGSIGFISRNGHAPTAEVGEIVSETTKALTEELTETVTEEQAEAVDAEVIAKELVDDYREFICDLCAGNLEVDKDNIVTRKVTTDDGLFYEVEYYLVTDQRYPTWADLEKRCYEVFDKDCGQELLDFYTDYIADNIGYPFIYLTENGYYIENEIHDYGMDQLVSYEYDMNAYTDENGNIIASVTETELNKGIDYPIPVKIFTIVNTENGWRISDVVEEPVEENEQ